MEQDPLKSAWQNMPSRQRSNAELQSMMQERSHPVLKGIRKQVIVEAIAFALFLVVYYDFFDGDKKPFYANAFLVGALLFTILHNITGYVFTKRPAKGDNIKQSLQHQLSKLKVYALSSIAGRALTIACILLFFMASVSFNTKKYWILSGIILILIQQMVLLVVIWGKRIKQLKTAISLFP